MILVFSDRLPAIISNDQKVTSDQKIARMNQKTVFLQARQFSIPEKISDQRI
ncbi:Uncharacterized protein dnm_069470 [Desulfonema magnum]|uniref:Uncharacterized protein n=1 Tax=Desulfonema magnum TaxID=45655 RepID=A0A975GRG5_9BACT|nr:Uncharacterized protein dnm_069470 [Desulfonema magnum]